MNKFKVFTLVVNRKTHDRSKHVDAFDGFRSISIAIDARCIFASSITATLPSRLSRMRINPCSCYLLICVTMQILYNTSCISASFLCGDILKCNKKETRRKYLQTCLLERNWHQISLDASPFHTHFFTFSKWHKGAEFFPVGCRANFHGQTRPIHLFWNTFSFLSICTAKGTCIRNMNGSLPQAQ